MVQIKSLQQELQFKRKEVEDMISAADVKDQENSRLWEQVSHCLIKHLHALIVCIYSLSATLHHSLLPHLDMHALCWFTS